MDQWENVGILSFISHSTVQIFVNINLYKFLLDIDSLTQINGEAMLKTTKNQRKFGGNSPQKLQICRCLLTFSLLLIARQCAEATVGSNNNNNNE